MTAQSEIDRQHGLYLEDLRIGQRFMSGDYRLDRARAIAFALEFDPQPFHTDDMAAASSLFEGLAASGWLTAAITQKLLVTGGLPIAGGLVGAGVSIDWRMPVRVDDTLQVETEIVEIRPSRSKPDRGMVSISSTTRNYYGQIVQILSGKMVVLRRPRSPDT